MPTQEDTDKGSVFSRAINTDDEVTAIIANASVVLGMSHQ